MTLRMPVVEIPLDDREFQRFNELFGQYEEKLSQTPGMWQKVNKEFRQSTAAILAQNQAMKELGVGDPGKLRQVESGWRMVAGFSGTILGNAMRITQQLLKWGTIFSGGLLGGSLWGLTHMAGDVAGYRRQAMGLGLSIGGMRSFDINMSRFVDPGAFLSAINHAVSNPALQGPLYALGVNPNGSTEQVSLSMLRAMRRLALNTPRGELGLMSDAYGLAPFGGLETLMRLQRTPASEFYQQLQAEQRDRTGLGLPPGVARKWQDFTTQMERAKSTIFKTFVVGLVPLEKPLERLSVALSGFISRTMSGPEIKKGIDALAGWLDTFSTKMESKKFQHAIDMLVSDTGTIAQGLHMLAKEIRIYMGWAHPGHELAQGAKDSWAAARSFANSASGLPMLSAAGHSMSKAQIVSTANQLDSVFGFAPGTMRRLVATESSFNPKAISPRGAAYGEGLGQLSDAVQWQYGLRGSMVFDPMLNLAASANYLASLVRHYHGNMQDALAAYNLGPTKFDTKYGGSLARVPKSVRAYVTAITPDSGIVITARHKTGASAVLSAAGLAGVPSQ